MSFRKRPPIPHGDCPIIVDVSVSATGARSLVSQSSEDFFNSHPIPMEEFTLSEELQAGVPLKEIPCNGLIGSNDPLDHNIDADQLLKRLNSAPTSDPTE